MDRYGASSRRHDSEYDSRSSHSSGSDLYHEIQSHGGRGLSPRRTPAGEGYRANEHPLRPRYVESDDEADAWVRARRAENGLDDEILDLVEAHRIEQAARRSGGRSGTGTDATASSAYERRPARGGPTRRVREPSYEIDSDTEAVLNERRPARGGPTRRGRGLNESDHEPHAGDRPRTRRGRAVAEPRRSSGIASVRSLDGETVVDSDESDHEPRAGDRPRTRRGRAAAEPRRSSGSATARSIDSDPVIDSDDSDMCTPPGSEHRRRHGPDTEDELERSFRAPPLRRAPGLRSRFRALWTRGDRGGRQEESYSRGDHSDSEYSTSE